MLESAPIFREELQKLGDLSVRLEALFNLTLDVGEHPHFSHTEDDTQAHGQPQTRLLLHSAHGGVDEGEQNVETDCEADSPVEFYLVLLRDLDALTEPGVFVPALGLSQALMSSVDNSHCLQLFRTGCSDLFVVRFLALIGGLDFLF